MLIGYESKYTVAVLHWLCCTVAVANWTQTSTGESLSFIRRSQNHKSSPTATPKFFDNFGGWRRECWYSLILWGRVLIRKNVYGSEVKSYYVGCEERGGRCSQRGAPRYHTHVTWKEDIYHLSAMKRRRYQSKWGEKGGQINSHNFININSSPPPFKPSVFCNMLNFISMELGGRLSSLMCTGCKLLRISSPTFPTRSEDQLVQW